MGLLHKSLTLMGRNNQIGWKLVEAKDLEAPLEEFFLGLLAYMGLGVPG